MGAEYHVQDTNQWFNRILGPDALQEQHNQPAESEEAILSDFRNSGLTQFQRLF